MNENELKPDFEELLETSSKPKTESVSSFDSKAIQVESNQLVQKKKTGKNSKKSTIKCASCDEDFSGPSKLMLHAKEVHNDQKPFKCKQCLRSYTNPKALKVHTRSHDEHKKFKCTECNASFHVKSCLISHSSVHSGQKFQCEACPKAFSSLSYMRQHQATHNQTGENFICTFNDCHKKFPNQLALRSHLKVHAEKKFICNICPSAFKTQQSLKIHSLKHTSSDSKLFQCHICGFATKYRQHFHDHFLSHSAKREFVCFHCGKKFKKKTLLVLHMQCHLSQRNFICKFEDCKKAFKTYNSYYAHKRKHEMRNANSPRYNCASCDKVFSSHSVLLAHRVIHTGEKTYVCHHQGCSKAYAHKQNLNMHLLTAHIEKGVTFKCDLCPKELANSNQLRVHLNKIHKAEKNVKCTMCEITFASTQLLAVHQKIHQPKAFNCEFCNYSANYENDLSRHLTKAHEENKEG
jgi:KRAB domain-containing zinc finger protein